MSSNLIQTFADKSNTKKRAIDETFADFPSVIHTTSEDGNQCQFCNLVLSDFKALNIHKRQKHPEMYFACPNVNHCENPGGEQTMFEKIREMVSHYTQKHMKQEDGKMLCAVPNCNQSYADRNGLNKHLNKHHGDEELRSLAANLYLKEASSHVHRRAPRWKK